MRVFSRRWDTRGALWIQDVPDLERYCYFVAGTVGILLDQVFRRQADSRLPLSSRPTVAVRFGVGLQLVNILKDSAFDAGEGRTYLPDGVDRDAVFELARADLETAATDSQSNADI